MKERGPERDPGSLETLETELTTVQNTADRSWSPQLAAPPPQDGELEVRRGGVGGIQGLRAGPMGTSPAVGPGHGGEQL
ncbi:hypothetical protein NDU88_002835 [Pleurodeles waltl]|uniref:Uncharacterized protein n=1 Tax=Pleurodeles waltl TaxID=8319 RepID=A0AAV7UAW3_PLEWA|nr:hypothetical protein NDU88_002835 [Pleurodeles waltl]